jgi:hypothetical protein
LDLTDAVRRHPRSHERDDFVFDPLHQLALIEQKINALDQSAPLAGFTASKCSHMHSICQLLTNGDGSTQRHACLVNSNNEPSQVRR